MTYLIGILDRDFSRVKQILEHEEKIEPFIVNLVTKQV